MDLKSKEESSRFGRTRVTCVLEVTHLWEITHVWQVTPTLCYARFLNNPPDSPGPIIFLFRQQGSLGAVPLWHLNLTNELSLRIPGFSHMSPSCFAQRTSVRTLAGTFPCWIPPSLLPWEACSLHGEGGFPQPGKLPKDCVYPEYFPDLFFLVHIQYNYVFLCGLCRHCLFFPCWVRNSMNSEILPTGLYWYK